MRRPAENRGPGTEVPGYDRAPSGRGSLKVVVVGRLSVNGYFDQRGGMFLARHFNPWNISPVIDLARRADGA